MRKWRPAYSGLSEENRRKGICRSKLKVYRKRGKIRRGPCEICGVRENVEAHHQDYSRPFFVVWLCRPHHVEIEALGVTGNALDAEIDRRRL
jgi:hypothetical protein